MFDWLKDIVFRTTVLREILELSGQIKPSRGRQIVYGLCIAYPYIVFSVFIFMVGFATYIRTRTEIYILLSGIGISFVALLYGRSEEHTSELQSLMRILYAVFCFKKKNNTQLK